MKQNAKELIAKIQSKLPRLMELREGQVIEFDLITHHVGITCKIEDAKRYVEFYSYKILGIKPTLADVLECFGDKLIPIRVNSYEIVFDSKGFEDFIYWNLSEPIENQSDELINCLLELC